MATGIDAATWFNRLRHFFNTESGSMGQRALGVGGIGLALVGLFEVASGGNGLYGAGLDLFGSGSLSRGWRTVVGDFGHGALDKMLDVGGMMWKSGAQVLSDVLSHSSP